MRSLICAISAVFLLALAAHAAGETPGPAQLAILPGDGDRAPAEEVMPLLEVALTQSKGITLVERAEIRKILQEQKLSASGLADPATALKLGKLLSADLFLFIERVPKSQPALCRVQVIETRTGMVLAGDLIEEKSLTGGADALIALVRQGMEKRAVPAEKRHYAGILGVRNEEPGKSLDGLARTLWVLLANDLQKSPNVVLLDREHLQWLRQERTLTDVELGLKASTVLLDGALRRSPEEGKVELTFLLTPLSGGAPERISLRLDVADIAAARKEMVAAVAARLKAGAPAVASDPAAEGRRFLAQSQMLATCGEKDAALRAAEAAYTLWPDRSTRLELALSYGDRVLDYPHRVSVGVTQVSKPLSEAPEADQVVSLQFQQQMLALMVEQYRADFGTEHPLDPKDYAYQNKLGLRTYPTLGIITEGAKGGAASLQPEVAALQRKLFDIVVEAARRDPKKFGGCYWAVMYSAVFNLQSGDWVRAQDKAKAWAEVLTLWRDAPTGRDDEGFKGFNLQGNVNNSLQSLRNPEMANARQYFVAAFSPFTDDQVPEVRFNANYALLIIDPADTAAAKAVLKYVRDEAKPEDYTRGRETMLCFTLWRAVEALAMKDPALAAKYCEEVIGPWMKEGGDSWRLGNSEMLIREWAKAVERAQGKPAADAIYARTIAALQDSLKRWPKYDPSGVNTEIRALEETRRKLGVAAPAEPVADDPWRQVAVRPLGLKLTGAADAVVVKQNSLYCIQCKSGDKNRRNLTVTVHRFPEGGPALRTENLTLPPTEGPMYFDEVWPVFVGDRLYIGTCAGLVLLDGENPPKLLGEADGVAGSVIGAMALYRGKLYMAIGRSDTAKRAFAVYDPAAGAGRVIFSNTALDAAQKRDLPIKAILSDEKRGCLWVAGERDGIWRFDPEKETIEKIASTRFGCAAPYAIHTMSLCSSGLLYISVRALSLVDLENGYKQTYLVGGTYAGPNGMDDVPLFKCIGDQMWPAYYDGAMLLTGGPEFGSSAPPYPLLYRKGQEPVPNRALRGLRLFEPTASGLLAMDSKGDGYLISGFPDASIAQNAERPK